MNIKCFFSFILNADNIYILFIIYFDSYAQFDHAFKCWWYVTFIIYFDNYAKVQIFLKVYFYFLFNVVIFK